MPVDDLWFLASRASQNAERTYHRLTEANVGFIEFDRRRHVSRSHFRTLATRVADSGAPYGAHTLVHRPDGAILLVRHEGADLWVLPGGRVEADESLSDAARRELDEEAGIRATYDGLAMLHTVRFEHRDYSTWGVLPVFEARPGSDGTPEVRDPEGEISAARWFADLPRDTRDRETIRAWRARARPG